MSDVEKSQRSAEDDVSPPESVESLGEESAVVAAAEESEPRGARLIASGLVATVILAVVAVVVAGIFQFTARVLLKCPTDLPVNDPAPILWEQSTSAQVVPQGPGVPERLVGETKLK